MRDTSGQSFELTPIIRKGFRIIYRSCSPCPWLANIMYRFQPWRLKLGKNPLTEHNNVFRVSAEISKRLKASEVLLVLLCDFYVLSFEQHKSHNIVKITTFLNCEMIKSW